MTQHVDDCWRICQEAVEAYERAGVKLRALRRDVLRVRKNLTDSEAIVAALPRDPHGPWSERE